jgi:hypothetical protein
VIADGNCLFTALALQMGRSDHAAAAGDIRNEIVKFLRQNQLVSNHIANSFNYSKLTFLDFILTL